MIRKLLLFAIIISSSYAIDFNTFLENALKSSPFLRATHSDIENYQLQGLIEQRYENPSLELETSSFDPKIGSKDNGFRAAIVQPLRLWGLGDAKHSYANKLSQEANAKYAMDRAEFIRDISLLYVEYVMYSQYKQINEEEIDLVKKIYDISAERFNAGTIPKGNVLQAEIELALAQNRYEKLNLELNRKYMQLLKIAGFESEVELSADHTFELSNIVEAKSPNQLLLERQIDTSLAIKSINDYSIEKIDFFAEFENEPDQDIARIGFNIPISIFNDKSEEKKIAQLSVNKIELLKQQLNIQQNVEQNALQKENISLEKLQTQTKKIIDDEMKLLEMFEESYKIANANLLELQSIKNKLIATKKDLIDITSNLQSNIINLNYLQGAYNE